MRHPHIVAFQHWMQLSKSVSLWPQVRYVSMLYLTCQAMLTHMVIQSEAGQECEKCNVVIINNINNNIRCAQNLNKVGQRWGKVARVELAEFHFLTRNVLRNAHLLWMKAQHLTAATANAVWGMCYYTAYTWETHHPKCAWQHAAPEPSQELPLSLSTMAACWV